MLDERRTSLLRRLQYVLAIFCAQAACLGVGLWMQHQFLHSSARAAALDDAWIDLSGEAIQVANDLKWMSMASAENPGKGPGRQGGALASSVHQSGSALIVDANWRVVSVSPSGDTDANGGSPGDRISWSPAVEGRDDSDPASRGFITVNGVQQMASAAPVGESGRTVVFYRSVALVEQSAEGILASLPMISGLTFVWTCALLSISIYMIFSRFYDQAERVQELSVAEGIRQRQDLIRTRDAVVFGLAKLADSRDPETGDHLERISIYTTTLASVLRHHPKYSRQITPAFIRLIGISSVLHDIGKVGIEDCILLKKGPLMPDERRIIQTHAAIGGECLEGIERRLGSSNFLQMAREIAFDHHERWDGTGYPRGLAGEAIPLSARIVAIADVYDALSSRRIYKAAHSRASCEEKILGSSGTHFDPELVEAWLEVAPKFAEIALRYSSAKPSNPNDDVGKTGMAPLDKYEQEAQAVSASTAHEPFLVVSEVGIGATDSHPKDDGNYHRTRRVFGDEDEE